MSSRIPALLASLAALLAAAPAPASVMIRKDVPVLARSADVVARGTVSATRPVLSGDGRRIFTLVTLDVAEAWKGAPPQQLQIRVHGGTYDGIGQTVQGEAHFEPGEEVVVFLQRIGPQQGPPLFRVDGMAQGKLTVVVDPGRGAVAAPDLTGLELTDSADQPAVKAASPRPVPLPELHAQVKAAVAP
jgi:hypothetical protein